MKSHHALALLPLAMGLVNEAARSPSLKPTIGAGTITATRTTAPKEFSIPLSNLRDWATKVVVTLDNVAIEGHSPVHTLQNDCEMHLAAHTSEFRGDPDGLVLEPMNACVQPFPGKSSYNASDWTDFGDQLTGSTVTASGVARIWPEHLTGGGASNPDHAAELHPLTTLISAGKQFDFSPYIFAGQYRGGVSEQTALAIVQNTSVSVTTNGSNVDISFLSGRIGNFATLSFTIDRGTIVSDGAGSFRMDAEVPLADATTVPVRIVTAKGSPINDEIQKIRSGSRSSVEMEALVLFSLSPEALLNAANESHGGPVSVDRPLQLILYGTPESE